MIKEGGEMGERRRRGSGIVGPLILIGLGLIFLLNNLGVVDWSIWQVIWRLWPVLLIAAGLDLLIGRRSALGALVVLVLTLALLAGGLWLLKADQPFSGRAVTTETIRQARGDATHTRVVIERDAGRLRIKALPESANLVEGQIDLAGNEKATPQFSLEGDKATWTLRADRRSFGPTFGGWYERRTWDLGLAQEGRLDLEVDLGVGEVDLDLTGLTIGDLDVNVAVGKTTVILPQEGDIKGRVDGAIGEVVVVIPEGVEARVQARAGLGDRKLPEGFRRQDDVFTSPGYARADNRVDLEVSLAMGSIRVRRAE
jgi:hypothetical protein